MNKIIEEALKAVPCAAREGLLCDAKHSFWAPCCRLMKAIRAEGQPIELESIVGTDEVHIFMYKRADAVRESYGVVKLIEPKFHIGEGIYS